SIFKPEAVPEKERLVIESVVSGLTKLRKPARELKDADAIVNTVAPELSSGDVVAILSNGGFGGIYEKLPRRLEELRAARRS
ncbi:MAG TPA: UDP-N-acetylmuramate:L-alanyl-gamma-D-glutamyl-meso-diaminopimelate ligase, partial [Candidatus Angelobacter sp.]|nr:UDP-N-acetylmuramate:L-alanyl-gamma-D-glutamyl-meso-diaminopimelate ligase [Candidatus Angelobacter sp.]